MPLPGSTIGEPARTKSGHRTGIENVTYYMKIVYLKVKTGACKSPIKVGHNHDRHEYNNQVPLPPSSPPHFHPFRCPFCRFFKNISQPRIPLLFTTAMSKVVHRSFSLWYLAVERICLFIAEKLDTWGLHSRRYIIQTRAASLSLQGQSCWPGRLMHAHWWIFHALVLHMLTMLLRVNFIGIAREKICACVNFILRVKKSVRAWTLYCAWIL